MLKYLFYPNLGTAPYTATSVMTFLLVSVALFIIAQFLKRWLSKQSNKQTKKLMKSWPSILRWWGGMGIVLSVARAEGVQYLSMRFLWFLWGVSLVLIGIWQIKRFYSKHYTVVEKVEFHDPRDKYLPKKKR